MTFNFKVTYKNTENKKVIEFVESWGENFEDAKKRVSRIYENEQDVKVEKA